MSTLRDDPSRDYWLVETANDWSGWHTDPGGPEIHYRSQAAALEYAQQLLQIRRKVRLRHVSETVYPLAAEPDGPG